MLGEINELVRCLVPEVHVLELPASVPPEVGVSGPVDMPHSILFIVNKETGKVGDTLECQRVADCVRVVMEETLKEIVGSGTEPA